LRKKTNDSIGMGISMDSIINKNEDIQARCNKCGRCFKYENGLFREDFFEGQKVWGYFSEKDLEQHSFKLCESCYDEMINGFVIPVKAENKTEAL